MRYICRFHSLLLFSFFNGFSDSDAIAFSNCLETFFVNNF